MQCYPGSELFGHGAESCRLLYVFIDRSNIEANCESFNSIKDNPGYKEHKQTNQQSLRRSHSAEHESQSPKRYTFCIKVKHQMQGLTRSWDRSYSDNAIPQLMRLLNSNKSTDSMLGSQNKVSRLIFCNRIFQPGVELKPAAN